MFMPFIEEKKVISQLRLGYTLNEYRHKVGQLRLGYTLNEYRHKVGLHDSPNCSCGGIETVVHYICDCEEYEVNHTAVLSIFLSLQDEVLKKHREALLMMLSDYITSTKRFLRK